MGKYIVNLFDIEEINCYPFSLEADSLEHASETVLDRLVSQQFIELEGEDSPEDKNVKAFVRCSEVGFFRVFVGDEVPKKPEDDKVVYLKNRS